MSSTQRYNVAVPQASADGALIDVTAKKITDGIAITLDLGHAPVPQRRYAPDLASVLFEGGILKLLLGQRRIGTDQLRSLIVISISIRAAHDFVESCNRMGTALDAFKKSDPVKLQLSNISEEPQQTVAMTANVFAVALVGDETCLDCYDVSPFAHRAAVQGASRVPIDPVVRLDLHTSLFCAIVDKMNSLREHFVVR